MTAVQQVQDFVQHKLSPFPFAALQQTDESGDSRHYRIPDIAILRDGDRFSVEVLHDPMRWLRLNPLYGELARRSSQLSAAERTHVLEHVANARSFVRNLRQRQQTLQQVSGAIVVRQSAFLRHGVRHLVPLTQRQIATDVGLHVSTVGRAVSEKAALLPDRNIWPMNDFFGTSLPAMDVLRELLAAADAPLTDQQLADLLAKQGFPLARRTVTKYRERLGVASFRFADRRR